MALFSFHIHGDLKAEARFHSNSAWVELRSEIGTICLPANDAEHAKRISAAINDEVPVVTAEPPVVHLAAAE